MLGSAVNSSTPIDFHSSSHMGQRGSRPLMNSHAFTPGPTHGCPYIAVGMQRALALLIGLPRRSTSALWMLGFLTPADVRRSFMQPPVEVGGECSGRLRIRLRYRLAGRRNSSSAHAATATARGDRKSTRL